MEKEPSIREDILQEAAELTGGDRNKTYGSPAPNLALTFNLFGELMAANALSADRIEPAEAGALMMVCAKLARIATGPVYHRDNYVDAAAYMAIAGECGLEGEPEIKLDDLLVRMGAKEGE